MTPEEIRGFFDQLQKKELAYMELIRQLEVVNADLLAACKAAIEHFNEFHPHQTFVIAGIIQAAIDRSEGER